MNIMNKTQRLRSIILLLTMLFGYAAAEGANAVAAVVNGENALQSEVDTQLAYYNQ